MRDKEICAAKTRNRDPSLRPFVFGFATQMGAKTVKITAYLGEKVEGSGARPRGAKKRALDVNF